MYKILITAGEVDCRWQSPIRKVESEREEAKVEEIEGERDKVRVSRVVGRVHLFKMRREGRESNAESSNNLQVNQIDIKTQVVYISEISSEELSAILKHLEQRLEHVELVEIIERQNSANRTLTSIVVYFKNILISEEFYTISRQIYQKLAFYIKQVILYEKIEKEESTEVLNHANDSLVIESIKSIGQIKEQPQEKNTILMQKWMELPQCTQCLEKLEYDITGLPPNAFPIKSIPSEFCKTCNILAQKALQTLQTHCEDCNSPEDNWICLVCNRVGCGRYKNADAFKHFRKTGHFITMDLETQRVWNYLSDCFSHRVIPLNKQEITLKFPDYSQQKNEMKNEQSLEGAFWEYCSVVSEQLQRQRKFYERMEVEQQERYEKELAKVNRATQEIERQLLQKSQIAKKLSKKNKKFEKRLSEIKTKCKEDRQLLGDYQRRVKQEQKEPSLSQIEQQSTRIQQKLKILQDLDCEISSILMKLTQ